jgi:uncharacterized protein (TIGR02996 family)
MSRIPAHSGVALVWDNEHTTRVGEAWRGIGTNSVCLMDCVCNYKMDKLLWLLGLSEAERAFVGALAEKPGETDRFLVFADWLEENGRAAHAERMKQAAREVEGGA